MDPMEMQQRVRDFLHASGSGYANGDWREMQSSAYFFINESSYRVPMNFVLYDDGERIEIIEGRRGGTHAARVTNANELHDFLAAHVPTGGRLEELRRAANATAYEQERIEAVRLAHVKATEACVRADDVAQFAAMIACAMRNNLNVVTVSGRQSLIRKTVYMVQATLEAALPAPTEY